MGCRNKKRLAAAAVCVLVVTLAGTPASAQRPVEADRGIAARYVADRGIEKDPDVIFADDFESWTDNGAQPPAGAWSMRKSNISRTHAVDGKMTTPSGPGPGSRVLEIACWTEGTGSQVGGLSRKLGNYNHANEGLGDGCDEIYLRWYQKFDENYRGVQNHGGNLGGRDLKLPDAAWVGMAAIRDIASRGYFYSGVQPYGKLGSPQMEMGFYSYHMDKKGPWGENYPIQKNMPIRVGEWHCVERHMKLNSVDEKTGEARADGVEELWIDGQLSIRKADVRFRRVPHLRITLFSLETYYHGLPKEFDAAHPIKVYYDDLVMARRYIGPMQAPQR
ncbi:MAG: hypothetical protein NTU53_23620 [Planctomycetota bacterium]|nr:hypothetical protein [Planctomycetota bacterium]